MTKANPTPKLLEPIPIGIPGLDVIWPNGFHRGGIHMVLGKPGAGKTILGNQICFSHASSGGRALFATLLTESHGRMLSHLKGFEFFEQRYVGTSLKYISGYQFLENEKLPGLLAFLRNIIRQNKATLLVIDGLVTAGAVAESELELKKFIHELQAFIELVGCTTLLLTGEKGDSDQYAVRTMVEGLVELNFDHVGMGVARTIEVVKSRGGAFLMGRHRFEITHRGITVYPRIETVLGSTSEGSTIARARLSFGIKSLDEMVGGGVQRASVTMLLGPSGSGKTILGLSCLAAGAQEKEPGLYFGFSETPTQLLRNAEGLGSGLARHLKSKLIEFSWQPPNDELIPDAMAAQVIAIVRKRGVRRLFIDGIGGFKNSLISPERTTNFFSALCNELRALGVATILSDEVRDLFGPQIEIPVSGLGPVLDNIIFLRHVEFRARLHRLISVLKMRGGGTDSLLREFSIGQRGIEVSDTFESAEAILSGIARLRAEAVTPSPPPGKTRARRGSRRQ